MKNEQSKEIKKMLEKDKNKIIEIKKEKDNK